MVRETRRVNQRRFLIAGGLLLTNQRRLLEAIGRAAPAEEVLSENFRRRSPLGAYATVERALHSLMERGLVEREGRGRAVVPDVFLRHWLGAPTDLNPGHH